MWLLGDFVLLRPCSYVYVPHVLQSNQDSDSSNCRSTHRMVHNWSWSGRVSVGRIFCILLSILSLMCLPSGFATRV
uniref:Uncharacterized protein n=1 Tax=Anguilla anguilla TaxID=7936 RepID=A0A0E9PW76_ANGAN